MFRLQSRFKANLGYMKVCIKAKRKRKLSRNSHFYCVGAATALMAAT